MPASVDFCGEIHQLDPDAGLVIGREGDLSIDDNPYLHRHFLTIRCIEGVWVLANVGSRLSATVVDPVTRMEAYVAPGASLPIVFERAHVSFAAGSTMYEFEIRNDESLFRSPPPTDQPTGATTIGGAVLNGEQRLLLLALAEPRLRSLGRTPVALPSNKEAANRLGWTTTKFNRKLDHLCQKFVRAGIPGLHGGPGALASQRRARLVEFAIGSNLVGTEELAALPNRNRGAEVDNSAPTY